MGHIHLRVLPGTRKWQHVVELLAEGAADSDVLTQSATAAERDLLSAADDPVYVEAVRLLLTIPLAARAEDFAQALRDADIGIQNRPTLFDLVAAITARLDKVSHASSRRTDLGQIAGRALTRTFTDLIGSALPGLFEATSEDVRFVARKLSFAKGIAVLTRSFYGNLVSDSLSYWLDRALAAQLGPNARFASVADRALFDSTLAQFTTEATRIIQEFSGGWYGKTLHEHGGFDTHAATIFGAVALKKIVEEMRMKGMTDA